MSREYGVVVALLALVVIFSQTTDAFLTLDNLRNIAQQSAGPALIACGMTVVIIVGEFDLSAGAILGFSGIVFAMSANTWGVFLALLVAIALGAGLGLVNGLIVTITGIEVTVQVPGLWTGADGGDPGLTSEQVAEYDHRALAVFACRR